LLFSLLTLLCWVALVGLVNGLAIFVLKIPIDNPYILQAGNLSATGILLVIAARLGWLGEIGITKLGKISTWLVTLALAVCIVIVGFYSFFEDISFALNSLTSTQEARTLLLRSLLVGFVEEAVFRGVLLYSLVRVWGKKRRGIIASVLVQAALFGIFHSLQVLGGASTSAVMANVLDTFIFGILAGAVVLAGRTLWPAIILHTVSNAFILIKGLSSPWIDPVSIGYLREALLVIPLVLLSLWVMLKVRPIQQIFSYKDPGIKNGA
jgi:membrane protease YdiL (CAAX protease family)